jgi:ABC-type glycerol-3-phosphate transport system substrate-binding protein
MGNTRWWERGPGCWCGLLLVGLAAWLGCDQPRSGGVVVTFPSSSVGAEAEVLSRQLARFMQQNPDILVERRRTPDAANQRHQLYVQWLNAHAADPDILQLDSIWTAQFAAADWLLPLDRFNVALGDFLPAGIAANRYRGGLFALPWFVDVGMLYYRSDLVPHAPQSYAEFEQWAARAGELGVRHGLVLQAARYEGLMTVFVEYLTAFGGELFDARGEVVVNSAAGRRALGALQRAFDRGIVPRDALTWQEEQVRFAFQNGHALFMRNWPYAYGLMQKPDSKVAGRFAVAPFPAADGGRPAAAFGGSQLAINKYSDQPAAAYRVIEFLLQPEQMVERARIASQWPPRPSLYRKGALAGALPIEPAAVEAILASAVPRPSSPVYSQLSEIVQIHLHRCLSQQETAAVALDAAAAEMRALLERVGLAPSERRAGAEHAL